MDYQTGLLGVMEKIYDFKLSKKQEESNGIVNKEMEEFCQRMASKYGINRGANLLELQYAIVNESYHYEEVGMKNEDAVMFLEKEREEILKRRDAMYDRMQALPVEGLFSLDRQFIEIGRRYKGSEKGGLNHLLTQAREHIENNGIDFPTEEYLQRIYGWVNNILDETEKEIKILQKGIHGEEYVTEQLRLYEGKYKVVKNIVLDSVDSQGNTSEVDAYIITDKGLVVAEIKNFGNENQRLHITSDGRWVIEDIHNGNILKRIDKSPVEQNTRHCLAVERLLKETFGEDCNIPIIPVIFIANNKVAIQNESMSTILRVSEFYTFVNSIMGGVTVSKEMQEKIEKLLNDKNIGARDFGVKSRLKMMESLEQMEKTFTQYILYNNEVAQEYEKAVKKNKPHVSMKFMWILAIPYVFFFLIDFTTRFKIFLFITYTLLLFDIVMGVGIGCLVFFVLFVLF